MMIDEIMKPYFDKKEEFDNKYIKEKNVLKMRLEKLRDNKEREIQEYLALYPGYESAIRRDLEQAYDETEKNIEEQLRTFDRYYAVDVKELVDVKHEVRKNLYSAKKKLELDLKEVKLQFDTVMLKMSRFEYEYDENHRVKNGSEFKKLFEESDALTELIHSIENNLKKIEECMKITELTLEEGKTIMRGMTPVEQEELKRRRELQNNVTDQKGDDEDQKGDDEDQKGDDEDQKGDDEDQKGDDEDQKGDDEDQKGDDEDQKGDDEDQKGDDEDQKGDDEGELVDEGDTLTVDGQTLVATEQELIEVIFTDVLSAAKKLRSVKLEENDIRTLSTKNHGDESYKYAGRVYDVDEADQIDLPNGEYLNRKDINKALDRYYRQNKGRTFKIKGIDATLEVNRKTIKKVKKALRDCSTVRLLREKKLGYFDVKRVYGRVATDEYYEEVQMAQIKSKMPTGDYVNLEEFGKCLKDVFVEKSPSWIERLRSKFRRQPRIEKDYYYGEEPNEELREAFLDFGRKQR